MCHNHIYFHCFLYKEPTFLFCIAQNAFTLCLYLHSTSVYPFCIVLNAFTSTGLLVLHMIHCATALYCTCSMCHQPCWFFTLSPQWLGGCFLYNSQLLHVKFVSYNSQLSHCVLMFCVVPERFRAVRK